MREEAYTQQAILQWFAVHHIPAWRVNTQGVPLHGPGNEGKFRPAPNKGMADILFIAPCPCSHEDCVGGVFGACEVKSSTGKLSEHQSAFLRQVEVAGGIAFVARAIEDVTRAVKLRRR